MKRDAMGSRGEARGSREAGYVLAGDVGGTHTRLGLFKMKQDQDWLQLVFEKSLPSREAESLEELLSAFLKEKTAVLLREEIRATCLGVPGPVAAGILRITNLPWSIDPKAIRKVLCLEAVEIINDMVAHAWGVDDLKRGETETLNVGRNEKGNRVLVSAGTGLGQSVLFWDGTRHVPSPSEGGHVEFGPRTRTEEELLGWLARRFDHVSYERIVSGPGLHHIYQFLKESGKAGREPRWLAKALGESDPAEIISEAARLKRSSLCEAALEMFVSIYGAAAGNVALQVMATGGVYLGGGIPPRILWKLREGTFLTSFLRKGRLSDALSRIPVKVILNERTALLGAARRAALLTARQNHFVVTQ
jgi:glucokinase